MSRLMGRAMMATGGASVLVLAVTAAHAAPWTSQIEAPPEMVNPLIIEDKCPGDTGWPTASQGAGRDIKIIMPKGRDCTLPLQPGFTHRTSDATFIGGTESNPARNVWIIGGKIIPPLPRPTTDPNSGTGSPNNGWPSGITARFVKGTFYIEGMHIDMMCTCRDALATANLGFYENGARLTGLQPAAKTPRVVVVNSLFEGTLQCGGAGAVHGDIVHAQGTGTMHELRMQNFVGIAPFQALFVPPRPGGTYPGHGVTKLDLENVAIRQHLQCNRIPNVGYGVKISWQESDGPPRDGVFFKQTYLKTQNNYQQEASSPSTTNFDANGCAIFPAAAGVKTPTGFCKGTPPAGDPVTSATVGRNYSRSSFTGTEDPGDPPPDTKARNRILSKAGFAAINRAMAAEFLGQGRSNDVVAYAYREHAKGAAAGSEDLCKAGGITWGGDVAEDALYITSALSAPADLDVIIGTAPAVRVTLPANQAEAGQQTSIQIGDKVGRPSFILWRDGVKISEWSAKATILSAPAIRNVSTYAGAQVIAGQPQQQAQAWFSAISTDQPEGDTGTKAFVVRAHRDLAADTMMARCTVEAGTATAADFSGGVLPVVDLTLAPGVLTADASILVAGDTVIEPDETAKIVCGDVKPSSYSAAARTEFPMIIRNDDTGGASASQFSIKATSSSLFEGTGTSAARISLEVTRTGTSADAASVDLCQVPSDTSGAQASASDFVDGLLRQEMPFAAGEMGTKYVERSIVADADAEPDEWTTFRLLNPSSGSTIAAGTTNVLIKDDDDVYSSAARINAGGEIAYVDSAGNAWAPDNGTGGSIDANEYDFAGTVDDALYRTSRYGASSYRVQVIPGVYDLFGLFSESDASNDNIDCNGLDAEDPSDDVPGRRLMVASVSAAGGDSVTSDVVDPYCDAGFKTAHRTRLARVNSPEGKITMSLRSATNSQAVPVLNGLEALKVVEVETPNAQEWLNAGAPEDARYTDPGSNTWRGLPPTMVSGCTSVAETGSPPIEGTEADELFWTRCQGSDMSFTIPIDTARSATRSVNLLFAEMTAPEASRVMDIYVQGALQIENLDVRSAAGALKQALIRTVSPVTIGSDGLLRVRVVAKTNTPAILSGISVVEPLVPQAKTEQIGWKSRKKIGKAELIKLLSPTMRSPSGNPLVVRKIDTTNSSVYVCHGACAPTATRGVQPDTEAANNTNVIEIMAHDPGDQTTSLFPSLARFSSTTDSFKVTIAELLPDGSLGVETIVTVNLKINRVL